MRVVFADLNNIKISFKSSEESLFIGDILKLSCTSEEGIVAQVFSIETPQDSDESIASAKISLSFSKEGKWVGWLGNVPSLEWEISKISYEDLNENLYSEDNVFLGTYSLFNSQEAFFDFDDFQKNTVIFSDNSDDKQKTFDSCIKNLLDSDKKLVIVDTEEDFNTLKDALILKAGRDFRLTFDVKSLEKIEKKVTKDASIKTKAIFDDIFSQIYDYLNTADFVAFEDVKQIIEYVVASIKIPEIVFLKNTFLKLESQKIYANNLSEIIDFKKISADKKLLVVDISEVSDENKDEFIDNISYIFFKDKNTVFISDLSQMQPEDSLIKKLVSRKSLKSLIILDYKKQKFEKYFSNVIFLKPIEDNESENANLINRLNKGEILIKGDITKNLYLYLYLKELELERESKITPTIQAEEIKSSEIQENEEVYEAPQMLEEEIPEKVAPIQEKDDFEGLYKEVAVVEDDFSDIAKVVTPSRQEIKYSDEDLEEIDEYQAFFGMGQKEYEQKEPIKDLRAIIMESSDFDEDFIDFESDKIKKEEIIIPERHSEKGVVEKKQPFIEIKKQGKSRDSYDDYKKGDRVVHQKYGSGVINRVIKHGNKRLCDISFKTAGKRLLDPDISALERF